DRPILARRATAFEQTWRWCRGNPALAAALALVVLVTAGGFAATLLQTHAARLEAARADDNAARAEERAEEVLREKKEQERLNGELRANQDTLRRTLYAAHVSLAPAALAAQNDRRAHDLLESHRPAAGQPDLRGFEWHYWKRRLHR